MWALISYLRQAGHEVAVCHLSGPNYLDPSGASQEARAVGLAGIGVPLHSVEIGRRLAPARGALARAWRPLDAELFPTLLDAEAVLDTVTEVDPDAVFVYHWDALAASRLLRGRYPRLGTAGDLSHLVTLQRWRFARKRLDRATIHRTLELLAVLRRTPKLMVELLCECEAAGDFAAQHAAWLRAMGVEHCEYLRTPIPDPAGKWMCRRDEAQVSERPRVLLIGHLSGIATLSGLRLFVRRILPRLERELGPTGFEVRIVGGYEAPADLREELARPSVVFCGHVDPPDDELRQATVLLVPTDVPLGVRVRILTGFSFGACVVAHSSNALGIPELVHGENVLLGSSGEELADGVVRAVRDPELRARLQAAGRETYERFFRPDAASAPIAAILERVV